jgi:hypothetical protein
MRATGHMPWTAIISSTGYRRGPIRAAKHGDSTGRGRLSHPRAELQAKSRHQHLASLGRYVGLGAQTSARVTAEADPAACRHPR